MNRLNKQKIAPSFVQIRTLLKKECINKHRKGIALAVFVLNICNAFSRLVMHVSDGAAGLKEPYADLVYRLEDIVFF